MNDNVVTKAVKEKEIRLIEEYKYLTKQVKEYEAAIEVRKRAIINLFKLQGIVQNNGVRLVEENNEPKMLIKELKEYIRNEEILDMIKVSVHIDDSIDNLKYVKDLPNIMADNVGETLKSLPK